MHQTDGAPAGWGSHARDGARRNRSLVIFGQVRTACLGEGECRGTGFSTGDQGSGTLVEHGRVQRRQCSLGCYSTRRLGETQTRGLQILVCGELERARWSVIFKAACAPTFLEVSTVKEANRTRWAAEFQVFKRVRTANETNCEHSDCCKTASTRSRCSLSSGSFSGWKGCALATWALTVWKDTVSAGTRGSRVCALYLPCSAPGFHVCQ